MKKALLALEDGVWFDGYSFGADREAEGEVVFCTSMTGYQEICTDPSYRGQMVVLTYPLIGIYGVNDEDAQSPRPWLEALIVRDYYDDHSNWRAEGSLGDYLKRFDVPAICGVDTRALTRHLRTQGTMRGVLSSAEGVSPEALVERARRVTPLSEKNLVAEVVARRPVVVPPPNGGSLLPRVVIVDCGTKKGIADWLTAKGAEAVVVPFDAKASEIMALRPGGVVFSNGPGDPATLTGVIATVRELIEAGMPLLGICLGHQVMGIAIGGKTSRLKFGHHGGNHPVLDKVTGRVYITSQNHEFQVDADSLPKGGGFFVSHVNLNDGSVEGIVHESKPIFSVQFHPEANPGPHDNLHVFDQFLASCRKDD